MERLAKITDLGAPVIVGSKSGEIYPAECYDCCIDKKIAKQLLKDAVTRLSEYEDLEEQGKLLRLPCAVGDTVYTLHTLPSGKTVIAETTADAFFCALGMLEGRFGETIFLTQSEAEAVLKKIQEGQVNDKRKFI